MVDDSKKQFNEMANDIPSKENRKRDNTAPTPPPPRFAISSGNKLPRGSIGEAAEHAPSRITPPRPMTLDITKGDPDKDLYIHGTIRSMEGYSFTAKLYDLPSQFGIEGGKISKLQIRDGDRIAANFDRGWDIEPQTSDDRAALEKIRTVLDPPEHEFKPIVSNDRDKDRGWER